MRRKSQPITNFPAQTAVGRCLEPQRRLITHRHAVQHITRRRSRPVSREMRTWLSYGDASGDRRSQTPATITQPRSHLSNVVELWWLESGFAGPHSHHPNSNTFPLWAGTIGAKIG